VALTPVSYYDRFRLETGDDLKPGEGPEPDEDCLWKDAEIFGYLNDAQMALARKTNAIRDFYDLVLSAGVAYYGMPERLFRPRHAKVTADDRRIHLVNGLNGESYGDDYGMPRQVTDELTEGPIEALVFDERSGRIRAAPKPTVAETVRIYGFFLPRERIKDENSKLELSDERYELALLAFMKKRAYEKHDADTLNKQLSQKFEAEYLREADEIISENKRRTRRSGTVKFGGGVW
jgi:hypothetical protein